MFSDGKEVAVLTDSNRIQRMSMPQVGSAATAQGILDIGDHPGKVSHGDESFLHRSADNLFSESSRNMDPLIPGARDGVPIEKYRPFAVDWRFLPDEALFVKDYIRHYLANVNNTMAKTPQLRQLWVNTLGRDALKSVQSAETLFIHISKTGGTSVSKLLYGKNLPPYSAKFWFETFDTAVRNFRSFSIVRHPVDRVVSFYKMVLAGGTDIMAYSQFARSKLRGLESFDLFIDYLANRKSEMGVSSLQLREQGAMISNENGEILVDRVFLLDRQRRLPAELSRWLSTDQIPHLNATKPNPVAISEQTRDKILKIYARDLEIYEVLTRKGGFADLKGVRFSEK